MKDALAVQPVAVRVAASGYWFQFYDSGILDVPNCGTDLDHAVTAVGWGTENGKDFLIVRNSWSTEWGEKGYIRLAMKEDGVGVCGVLMGPNTVPLW